MSAALSLIGLLAWLQAKHFVADYLLQPRWIIQGKGDIRHPAGYVHAAIHAAFTLPGLMLFGLEGRTITMLALGELSIHFLIDHLKAVHARRHPVSTTSRAFWAAHGLDQLLHHFTYSALLLAAHSGV